MRLDILKKLLWPFGPSQPQQAVLQDAEDLIGTWGDSAYTIAATMSWREDMGLIYAAQAGHWARVKREIGHRRGWQDEEAETVFAAGLDRLWQCA